jgi:hypothetical protein
MKTLKIAATFLLCLLLTFTAFSKNYSKKAEENNPDEASRLLVVWTSGDKDVAKNMVFMYTTAAKKNKWWDKIRFLIWGASTKLLSEDTELQEGIQKMKESGIEVYACKACADIYGVSAKLEEMGITVKLMGKDLTDWIKSGWTTLTF